MVGLAPVPLPLLGVDPPSFRVRLFLCSTDSARERGPGHRLARVGPGSPGDESHYSKPTTHDFEGACRHLVRGSGESKLEERRRIATDNNRLEHAPVLHFFVHKNPV